MHRIVSGAQKEAGGKTRSGGDGLFLGLSIAAPQNCFREGLVFAFGSDFLASVSHVKCELDDQHQVVCDRSRSLKN